MDVLGGEFTAYHKYEIWFIPVVLEQFQVHIFMA